MRKDPSNPKYIRVEVRIGPITREVIGTEVVGQTEDSMETIGLDKTIGTTIFEGTPEDMEDKIIKEIIEIICAMNIIEAGMGQEKEHPQGIMVTIEIEVPVTVDQGQGLKLVPTEIG